MNLFDRWLNSARIVYAPPAEAGATAPSSGTDTAVANTQVAAPAPAAGDAAAAAPGASETPAAPAASEAPAAKTESPSSLIGDAKAFVPGKDNTSDQGSEPGKTPAEAAAPATDTAKPDATKTEPAKDPAKDPGKDAGKDGADGKDKSAPADGALAEKPQARTYDAFAVPEGIKLDDKRVSDFTGILENPEFSHQERGQKLVDLYVGEVKRIVQEQREKQLNDWADFTDQLKSDFKKDAEFGGNREETSLGIAKYVVEQLGGTPEQVADHIKMLSHTGMGNYVGTVRLLNTIYEKFLKPPSPVPGNAPNRATRGNFQDVMYGPEPGAAG